MPVLMELSQDQKLQVECRVKVLLNMLLLTSMYMHTGIQSTVCECLRVHPSVHIKRVRYNDAGNVKLRQYLCINRCAMPLTKYGRSTPRRLRSRWKQGAC